jgi:hypothetical protein
MIARRGFFSGLLASAFSLIAGKVVEEKSPARELLLSISPPPLGFIEWEPLEGQSIRLVRSFEYDPETREIQVKYAYLSVSKGKAYIGSGPRDPQLG